MADEKSVIAVIRASRPSFRNNADKIAFVVHSSLLAAGYGLTATGPPAFSDSALYSSSIDEVGIDHWNDSENEYAFVYSNPEKGKKKVLVKCLVMNDKLLVDALTDGLSQPLHLEINIPEFIGENGGSNYSTHYKNLEKLVKSLDHELLSKLNGSSSKPSSSSNQSSLETRDGSRQDLSEPGVYLTPSTVPPHYHPSGVVVPPVNPIGGSDIFPGPGAGMYPPRDFGSGGSMLIGPNDPRWIGGGAPNFPGGQPGVPPGARFDPYGPPGVPGFEPNRFVRNRGRGPHHPDLEHFRGIDDTDFI